MSGASTEETVQSNPVQSRELVKPRPSTSCPHTARFPATLPSCLCTRPLRLVLPTPSLCARESPGLFLRPLSSSRDDDDDDDGDDSIRPSPLRPRSVFYAALKPIPPRLVRPVCRSTPMRESTTMLMRSAHPLSTSGSIPSTYAVRSVPHSLVTMRLRFSLYLRVLRVRYLAAPDSSASLESKSSTGLAQMLARRSSCHSC